MKKAFPLSVTDRVLLVLPHPDDETLATGGLIQHALAAGVQLRVVIATDGDLNPWPQRWIERRWSIDANDRQRWGLRRREEAQAALGILGVPVASVSHLGWPDGGLTHIAMQDDRGSEHLSAEVVAFKPTVVVAPVFSDLHPDHNALRVLTELALSRTEFSRCLRLGYVVHGSPLAGDGIAIELSAAQQALKERALDAHQTQMRLSAKRLSAIARRVESFDGEASRRSLPHGELNCRLPWTRSQRFRYRHQLLVIVESESSVERHALQLPRFVGRSGKVLDVSLNPEMHVSVRRDDDGLEIAIRAPKSVRRVFFKIERTGSRLLIYDADGWHVVDVG